MTDTTVAAISTPFGKGGIAVIRISGNEAIEVAARMFCPANGRSLTSVRAREAVFGSILLEGELIDTGIATVFRAPASFTGEDTVEISCHGGILLTETVLRSAFLCGAEPAGAGEFTKRAFLNGKLSLTEAEGVIDLIDAESTEQIRLASAQVRGRLSGEIASLSERLTRLLASVYAYIDYPDEDLTDVSIDEMHKEIVALRGALARLLASYRTGKAVREGVRTAIVGKPNTGKSSLLNLLVGEERAIVTDIPGTTRDTVEESVTLGRVMLRLCDTAGMRQTDDAVEKIGVARSIAKMEDAELILGVFDGSCEIDAEDNAVIDRLIAARERGAEVIVIVNKADRPARLAPDVFPNGMEVLTLSAKTGGAEAREKIGTAIERRFIDGSLSLGSDAVVSNARQYASLSAADEALSRAQEVLEDGLTQDLAGMDLELALARLTETDGRAASGAIVDEIFSRFCVGK